MDAPASGVVRWIAKAASLVFYRVDSAGRPPSTGAALLLPNHPNALLDPAVIWSTAGRDVRFLAKSTLFRGPFAIALRGAGAIPVYRRIDPDADLSLNAGMFAAVNAALAAGDAVCLFPEGISHSSGRLEPLRTGAARMALSAERDGTAVALVPVGLNFDRKGSFRSRVTVMYGAPFSCADLIVGTRGSAPDAAHAVRALTDRIADRMRNLIVEADPAGDAHLVDRVDRLYAAARGRPQDPAERTSRRRLIATGIQALRTGDPARYNEILLRIRRYDARLQRFGIRDRHLDWQTGYGDALRFALREAVLAVCLVPIGLAGLVLFAVPYHATAVVARRVTREPDVLASAQVFSGAAIYAVWIALLSWLVWRASGAAAAMTALAALPLVALASLLAIERESSVLETVRAWLLLRRAREDTRARLRQRRSELADVLDEVRAWVQGGIRNP